MPAFGLTGTREQPTPLQLAAVRAHLETLQACAIDEHIWHHGGCVGFDRCVHNSIRSLYGYDRVKIVIHPASDQPTHLCDWSDADGVMAAKPALERNRDIVAACFGGVLLAGPRGPEELRSGTWATVRHARKVRRGIVLFWPDGSVTSENPRG